ncbi:hypothetical protein ACVWXN_007747 [Bradyrhizobium sp. i1.4.4]
MVEVTGEDGKPAQHEALGVGQEPVAPVQRRLQRLLPRRRGALALPEQIEAFVEQCGRLLQSVGLDPAGGELDRQRHAVELAADPCDDRGIDVIERDLRAAGHGTFEEELKRGIGLRGSRGQPGIVRRNGERRQPVDLLALDTQGLAARGEDMDMGCGVKDFGCQRRRGGDDMLAIIQDQQHPLVAEMREQCRQRIVGLRRQAQHQQDRGDHEIGIAERGEVDEMRGIGESLEQVVRDRHRNGGLADAARADDRDEVRADELVGDGGDRIVAPDHPLQPVRQLDGR